jgi:hypothetical protein
MDSHLERLRRALTQATLDMTSAELVYHPEGKWSAAEVLEHLYLTYTGTAKGMGRCLERGRPLAHLPTFRHRLTAVVVVGCGYLASGRSAPEYTRPRGMAAEKVAAEIGAQIAAMDAVITQCETQFGKNTKLLDHAILGPLTGAQWRKFHWVHGRHHIKQISRLRSAVRSDNQEKK